MGGRKIIYFLRFLAIGEGGKRGNNSPFGMSSEQLKEQSYSLEHMSVYWRETLHKGC